MDAIREILRGDNERQQMISRQGAAIDEETVNGIMSTDAFSIEKLEAENIEKRMDFQQGLLMFGNRLRKKRYTKELCELEKHVNTLEGKIAYLEKIIQMERNDMEMRLLMASVLGRGIVAKRIMAESLGKITKYRREMIKCYEELPVQRKDEQGKKIQETELDKEEAAYQEAVAEFEPRMRIAATLDKVKAERADRERQEGEKTEAESVSGLIQEFLAADFSEQTLAAGYVIKNLDSCLHNVELIRRLRKTGVTGDDEARVKQKLAAVEEYENVVESTLWDYGVTVDFQTLQFQEIKEGDEAFARKRQKYLANGALRFWLDRKKYRQIGESGAALHEATQQESGLTRVEGKLSALEAELGMQRDKKTRITRALTRRVSKLDSVQTGDTIRADSKYYKGKMEHLQVKMRLLMIYRRMMRNLKKEIGEGGEAFASLEKVFSDYVLTNRTIFGDREEAEAKEAKALTKLKRALATVQSKSLNQSSIYAAILLGVLTEENDGYLEVPPGEIQVIEDNNIVLGNKKTPGKAAERYYQDCKDMPLFTHRPNSKDIRQGNLGDCYLLAGLISVVDQNPEEIMNIMRDNGDGTVTVCFKPVETDASGKEISTPYYVTVRKTIPVDRSDRKNAFSQGALWVKMIEKAYAASKLHLLEQTNKEREERREAPLPFSEWKRNGLHGGQQADYDDIGGGFGGRFVRLLIGRKSEANILDKNRAEHVGNRIGRMLPAVNEPRWKTSSTRKFGNESVDSIVYEYIKKQGQGPKTLQERVQAEILARKFLNLEKSKNRGDAAYQADKEALQKYRRTCILNLDMVESIARETKQDILQLDSEENIRKWYAKLKDMYCHYLIALNNKSTLNDEDKIIQRVQSHYAAPDFEERFLILTAQQFNDTLDILQQRHLELFRRKQAGGQGAGAQVRDRLYSARDLKLFGRIEGALRSGDYTVFDTRELSQNHTGKNGESEAGGMVGTHAYTIINTRRIEVNGEERLFFVVMNPWAEQGVVYEAGQNAGEIRKRSIRGKDAGEKEEGVFYLELSKFAEVVKHWEKVPA